MRPCVSVGVGGWGGGMASSHAPFGGLGEAYTQNATHCLLGFDGCGEVCFMYSEPPPPNPGDAAVLCKRMHNARLCMCVVVITTWWGCGAGCRWRVAWVRPLLLHPHHIRQLCRLQADGEASTLRVQPLSCGRTRVPPPPHPHCTHT